MSDLSKLYQSILLDPCNEGAERRNWANIKDALEEIEDQIQNINVNGGDTNIAIAGDTLVFFECTATQIGSSSCPVARLVWDGANWAAGPEEYVAYDWSTSGMFNRNFVTGHQGIGVLRENVGANALMVITLEGFARFILCELDEPFVAGTAGATLNDFWGAYPNIKSPGTPIEIHDDAAQGKDLSAGDKVIAVLDEVNQKYVLLTNYVDPSSTPPTAEGDAAIVRITTGAMGCADTAYNAYCVWSGKIQTVNGAAGTMCGSPWVDGIDVWILDANSCTVTGTAPSGDRFLAYSTGISYNPGGYGARPLYVIKHAQSGGGGTGTGAVIKIYDPGSSNCAQVDSDANCLYSAYLQTAAAGPDACNLWSNGAQIWAVATNQCTYSGQGPSNNDCYIAIKIADVFGPGGDYRALYAFQISELNTVGVVKILGSADPCEPEPFSSACVWEGRLQKVDETGGADLCDAMTDDPDRDDVWVVQVNLCTKAESVRVGERYIAVAIGHWNSRDIYAIQTMPTNDALVRWGKVISNWVNTGTAADYCYAGEITSLDDETPISPDPDDPNYDGSKDGYKIYLPHRVEPNGGHPNVVANELIAFQRTKDGKYTCVSDYMDAQIGTVLMTVWTDDCQRSGWAIMDGTANSIINGGSGFDMRTFFPRMPSRDTEDLYGWVGDTGGRTMLPIEELEHVHSTFETAGLCSYLDPQFIMEDPTDYEYYPRCYVCIKDSTWDKYIRDEDNGLLGGGEWGDGVAPGGAPVPIDDVCEGGPVTGEDYIEWGPINITPKYRNLQFIERIDNSGAA